MIFIIITLTITITLIIPLSLTLNIFVYFLVTKTGGVRFLRYSPLLYVLCLALYRCKLVDVDDVHVMPKLGLKRINRSFKI